MPETDIDVRVHRDVTLATKVDGEIERKPDGRVNEETGVMQFDADSDEASKLHWVQFFKESEYDANLNAVKGGSATDDETAYHENGEWYVDMPLPPADGKSDPDAIFYDHPPNGNLVSRSDTKITIFDKPTNTGSSPGVRAREVEFKTYLVDANGPRWEISWTLVTVSDAQGNLSDSVRDIKGRPVKTFAPPVDTKHWNIGKRVKERGTGGKPPVIGERAEQAANPFARS